MPDPPAIQPDLSQLQDGAQELDLRGLRCPMPVLRTRRALARAKAGTILRVTCTDPLAGLDIPHLLNETGNTLLHLAQAGTTQIFLIRKA